MKQRHSYTNFLYHVVIRTKNREHFIHGAEEEQVLKEFMKLKAHKLDAWVEEFGGWFEHVHVLLRVGPNKSMADVYGQLKGFCSWSWRSRWPDRPFAWSDGVYAVTVDPENCQALRHYIRNQRPHHSAGSTQPNWEPDDSPPGLTAGYPDRAPRGRGSSVIRVEALSSEDTRNPSTAPLARGCGSSVTIHNTAPTRGAVRMSQERQAQGAEDEPSPLARGRGEPENTAQETTTLGSKKRKIS